MTRQKKEILKKIDEIERFIEVDMQLGCGFAPVHFYDPLYEQIHELQEELARLSHYPALKRCFMTRGGRFLILIYRLNKIFLSLGLNSGLLFILRTVSSTREYSPSPSPLPQKRSLRIP